MYNIDGIFVLMIVGLIVVTIVAGIIAEIWRQF